MNDFLLSDIAKLREDIQNPATRTKLGELPFWGNPLGAGRCRFLDVVPIRSAPRVRGMIRDTDPDNKHLGSMPILASPLGIVCVRSGPLITVMNPDTGEVHATTPVSGQNCPPLVIDGEMLVVKGDSLFCVIDMWKDADLYRSSLKVESGQLAIWSFARPRNEVKTPVVRVPCPKGFNTDFGGGIVLDNGSLAVFGPYPLVRTGMVVGNSLSLVVSKRHVILNSHKEFVNASEHAVLSSIKGDVLWKAPGVAACADEEGILAAHVSDELTLRDYSGKVRWTATGGWQNALSPTRVVTRINEKLRILNRADGSLISEIPESSTFIIQGDQIVCAFGNKISAFTLDGQHIWTHQSEEDISSIAPYPGRLYAFSNKRTFVCLEEAG